MQSTELMTVDDIMSFIGQPTRTVEECMVSFRVHLQSAAANYIAAGRDLMEIKAQAPSGKWLAILEELQISASAAENHMKLARELSMDSPLAAIPYSNALELMKLPSGEREAFAEEIHAETLTKKEVQRLVAEKLSLTRELEAKEKDAQYWQRAYQDEHDHAAQLRLDVDKLKARPPEVVEKTVETAPADYAQAKQERDFYAALADEAERAALEAEARSRELLDELNGLRREQEEREDDTADTAGKFTSAVNTFLAAVQLLPMRPEYFTDAADNYSYRMFTQMVLSWGKRMMDALDEADQVTAEAVVA